MATKKKKKNKVIEAVKSYWWIIAVFSALVGYSSNLMAMWNAPASINKTNASIEKLSDTVQVFIASQDQVNISQQNLNELLTANLLKRK